MVELGPVIEAYLALYPADVLITRAKCPTCRRWTYVDLLAGEAVCRNGHPLSVLALIAARHADHPTTSRLPAALRARYPLGLVCRHDGSRLTVDVGAETAQCPQCAGAWTWDGLMTP